MSSGATPSSVCACFLQVRNVLTTCFVYCGPFFLTFCFNNTVAWIYGVRLLLYTQFHPPAARALLAASELV